MKARLAPLLIAAGVFALCFRMIQSPETTEANHKVESDLNETVADVDAYLDFRWKQEKVEHTAPAAKGCGRCRQSPHEPNAPVLLWRDDEVPPVAWIWSVVDVVTPEARGREATRSGKQAGREHAARKNV